MEPLRWSLKDPRRQTLWGAPAPRSWFEEGTPFTGQAVREPAFVADVTIADSTKPRKPPGGCHEEAAVIGHNSPIRDFPLVMAAATSLGAAELKVMGGAR